MKVSEEIDICPVDNEKHPGCEYCDVSYCARGFTILRIRAKKGARYVGLNHPKSDSRGWAILEGDELKAYDKEHPLHSKED